MRIELDNADDRDGCVLVTTEDVAAALEDQSVAGAKWEGRTSLAIALPVDRPGLVEELEKEGYQVVTTYYSPPD